MVDDLGYEALGSYGGVSYKTPELDRLAKSGIRFTHAYASPLCSPSRVKIMTGRYNHRNYENWGILPKTEITFANLLHDAGYATFVTGKWQLKGHTLLWDSEEPCCLGLGQTPLEAGFDDYLLFYLDGKGSRYADPLVWRKGEEAAVIQDGYGPDLFTNFMLDKIENQVAERPARPFFAYYPMVLTHPPIVPTPDSTGWDGDRNAAAPGYFADMVAYTDKMVGRTIRKLDELGIRDNTLILFTADNGTPRPITSTMSDGTVVIGEKARTTDGGTHVPFIASWPGAIEGGKVSDALIDLSDFLPSLVEIAKAKLPKDRVIDGRSFLPILRGEVEEVRDWIYTDYRPQFPGMEDATYAQDRRFKLYNDGRFFDVPHDVFEERPLSAATLTKEAAAARETLQGVLDKMAAK
jgi:arylsulfatase A-like enzyme